MKQQNNDANDQKPNPIQTMKSKKMKAKMALPHWERIQELVDRIQSVNISEQIPFDTLHGSVDQILCYRDLCENDITFHLILNQHFDFFLSILEKSISFSEAEHNQIVQSVIKGIISIKNEKNYQKICSFVKRLRKICKQQEEANSSTWIRFKFDIVIESHFNFYHNLQELQLLSNIYKLLSYGQAEQQFLLKVKQNLEFDNLIISKKESRRRLQHLNQQFNTKIFIYKHYSIYRQICDNQKWDKIINISNEEMFGIVQDGLSPYMKMLQKAPFEFLAEYHKKHFNEIQNNIEIQRKKHGYNMLHCIAENTNKISQEFIEILKRLNLEDYKNQAYFDQIPLVFYIEKQKILQDQFLAFLSNQKETQSYADQEGLQIIAQIYAKWVYDGQQATKTKYRPKYKKVPGCRKNRNNKVKSLYKKQANKENIFDQEIFQQFQEIYQQVIQLHKINHLKGTRQEFEISQYSFSNCDLQSQLFHVEEPIIIWNNNIELHKKFLKYMEIDFGKNLSQDHIQTIQSLIDKLKIKASVPQLILQRKIILLNAVLNKFEGQEDMQQLIKDSISNILNQHSESLEFAFVSYQKYECFQDYLLFNNLISIEQYQLNDPFIALKHLLKLGYKNQQNLSKIASKISQPKDLLSIESLFNFEVPKQTIKIQNIYKQKQYELYCTGYERAAPQQPLTFTTADLEKFIQFYIENLSKWTLRLSYYKKENEIKLKELIKLLFDFQYLAQTTWAYRIFKKLVISYILIFENFETMKPFFDPKRYSKGQNSYLIEYFLNKSDIRAVEKLLIVFQSHNYFQKYTLDKSNVSPFFNYHLATAKGWSLGLNEKQFKELIEHNEISEDEKNQVLNDLSVNGQYAKLRLVLGWIKSPEKLEEQLALPALCNYQDISYYYGLKQAVKDGYTKHRYHFYQTLSPFDGTQSTQKPKLQPKIINNKCLFSSNHFQTDFAATAKLLNDTLIEKLPENTAFSFGYNSLSQIIFPNKKYLATDSDGRLLKKIMDAVVKNQYQENWDEYLMLIEQNIEFYNDSEFRFYNEKKLNLSFIFKIEITSKRGQFFKKMIDIFIRANKLENTLKKKEVTKDDEEEEQQSGLPARFVLYLPGRKKVKVQKKKIPVKPNYSYRRSQYLFNATRFDQIKKNRFADILKDHFCEISFETIEVTKRHRQIYYGQPFENLPFNEQDLFIALMSRRQLSILQVLQTSQNISSILTNFKIIQYLIMHGGEQTVIEILNLVDQVNLEWFYYKSVPLLTYIVFKKWYKLYSHSEKYLFDQWNLKPAILNQIDNDSTIELSIHQFATLNQFYVQSSVPFEKELLARTSQFLIQKENNQQLKTYQIYFLLVKLFPRFSRRDLEIFCLQSQFLEITGDSNYLQVFDFFTKQNKMKISLFSLLTLYTPNPDQLAQSLNFLIKEFGQSFETNISNMTSVKVKELFDEIYNIFGLYHPAIDQIINIFPNDYINERILDSPRLAVMIAQSAEYANVKSFIDEMIPMRKLQHISLHLMKIIINVKYGHEYADLFNNDRRVHLKYYVETENLINENQQGSITQSFLNQAINLLNVKQPQSIDYFYQQVLGENNQVKRAFKLIIKIYEFNYLLEQIKQTAIAHTDYLIQDFDFEISDHLGLNKESTILIPFEFTEEQLVDFYTSLPPQYQTNYKKAILKGTYKQKGIKKMEKLKIVFEESNLSALYNDLIFMNSELRFKANPNDIFVYTFAATNNQSWFNQLLQLVPITDEQIKKYGGQEIFINHSTVLSQSIIKSEISESVKQLNKNIKQGIRIQVGIEPESYLQTLLKNEELIKVYNNPNQYFQAIANYPTLIQILNYALTLIEQIIDLFAKNQQCIIRFESIESVGTSPRICFLDQYFSFGQGYLIYEDSKLIFVIQISCTEQAVPNPLYLDKIFNQRSVDAFIQNKFKLAEEIDGLIYRYQFQKILRQSCNRIRKQTNFDFKLELNPTQIKQHIQSFDYQEQVQYLRELQIYFSETIVSDFNQFIQSQRVEQDQQNQLLSLHKFSNLLKLGYIGNKLQEKLKNRFGILLTQQIFKDSSSKNDILHVCYFENNQAALKFCKFVKIEQEILYYIDLSVQKKNNQVYSRYNKKKKEPIQDFDKMDLKNIKFVISYKRILKPLPQDSMLSFIDNGGNIYLIAENEVQNLVTQQKLLTSQSYKIVLSTDCIEKDELYLNNFRLKDPQETLSKIDPEVQIELHNIASSSPQYVVDARLKTTPKRLTCAEKLLLKLFNFISDKHTIVNPLYQLPKEIDQAERKEFIPYCMLHQTVKYSHSRAGQVREDRIRFYDLAQRLITAPVDQSYLNFHITHEAYNLIYVPTVVNNKSGEYTLSWKPKTKGVYFLYMNGDLTVIKFQVIGSTALNNKYELINQNQLKFSFFLEKELRLHLFDEFENFLTKVDDVPISVKVISKTPNVTFNYHCESKNDCFSLYLQPCNYVKNDDVPEDCELEIQICDTLFIQSLQIQVEPKRLSKERLQQFKSKFHYVPSFYKILYVERENAVKSCSNLNGVTDQSLMKFVFPKENADEGEGPEREYFTQLGIELKSQEKKYFAANDHNLYFISSGFDQEGGLGCAYTVGLLLAYAIANQLEVCISFALPFWKVLIELPIEFTDLEQIMDTQSYQNYQKLKILDEQQLSSMELKFVNQSDGKELCQNGTERKVDKNNLDEYLQLTAQYLIYEQHKDIFEKLKSGFKGQYDPKILINNFTLDEINKIIDHSDSHIDNLLDKIEFDDDDNNKGHFVQYIQDSDQEKLKLLLKFTTGSMYPKEDENGKIIKVKFSRNYQMELPTARTCSRKLDVPKYGDYATLKMKLDQALELGWNYFGQY